jgi:hypothetical protein
MTAGGRRGRSRRGSRAGRSGSSADFGVVNSPRTRLPRTRKIDVPPSAAQAARLGAGRWARRSDRGGDRWTRSFWWQSIAGLQRGEALDLFAGDSVERPAPEERHEVDAQAGVAHECRALAAELREVRHEARAAFPHRQQLRRCGPGRLDQLAQLASACERVSPSMDPGLRFGPGARLTWRPPSQELRVPRLGATGGCSDEGDPVP